MYNTYIAMLVKPGFVQCQLTATPPSPPRSCSTKVGHRQARGLSEQEQFPRLHLRAGLQPIEIHPAGQLVPLLIAPIPLQYLGAGFLWPLHQGGDTLAQQVVDG